MKPKPRTLLIVCTEANRELERRLVDDGWVVVWVYDARSAIARVRREQFDRAVLISTGKEMDITETFFNLRDICETMAMVVLQPAGGATPLSSASRLPPQKNAAIVEHLDDLLPLLSISSQTLETRHPEKEEPV